MDMNLILASTSPRRAALLDQLRLKYKIMPAEIDEQVLVGEDAKAHVKRLAIDKADAVFLEQRDHVENILVLGADTSIEVEGQVVGKPTDFLDAKRIWQMMMGKTHLIHTGFCLISEGKMAVEVVTSSAIMQTMTNTQMQRYWQSNEPKDKAGGYAIQGIGAQFISHISGSYSSIMGLPLFELANKLKQFEINPLESDG